MGGQAPGIFQNMRKSLNTADSDILLSTGGDFYDPNKYYETSTATVEKNTGVRPKLSEMSLQIY